jgi:hypothetical protein
MIITNSIADNNSSLYKDALAAARQYGGNSNINIVPYSAVLNTSSWPANYQVELYYGYINLLIFFNSANVGSLQLLNTYDGNNATFYTGAESQLGRLFVREYIGPICFNQFSWDGPSPVNISINGYKILYT